MTPGAGELTPNDTASRIPDTRERVRSSTYCTIMASMNGIAPNTNISAVAASASVERLSQSLKSASANIERGGGEMSATLQRELSDLSKVLDDFTSLLEERVQTIGAE